MADRWMDQRDREWRERDWRRSEQFGRGYGRGSGGDGPRSGDAPRWGEERSWSGAPDDDRSPYEDPMRNNGEYGADDQEYGAASDLTTGGVSGRGQARSQGRGLGGEPRFRPQDYTRSYADEAGRADYDYSPRGGYGRQGRSERDYGERDYGERDYGQRDYGQGSYAQPGHEQERRGGPSEDRWRQEMRQDERRQTYRQDRGRDAEQAWAQDGDRSYNRDLERRYAEDLRHRASGGTGGYDYERGYGDAGRSERPGREPWEDRRDQGQGGEGGPGDFLSRAGERISSWFRGDHLMRGSREDERGEPRRYREDFAREARPIADKDHRGHGPRGYRRSDERISDEVHDRLTDDPWLDASNIQVEVKGGEITLSGAVDNREAKHRAERLVEDISGVSHVQNNLRVDPNASFTGAGRGFGSSALESEMRRNSPEAGAENKGASGRSGRTSTGALAERSAGTVNDEGGQLP